MGIMVVFMYLHAMVLATAASLEYRSIGGSLTRIPDDIRADTTSLIPSQNAISTLTALGPYASSLTSFDLTCNAITHSR